MKTCTRCGKTLSFDNFYKRKKATDRLNSECKNCTWDINKTYRRTENGFMTNLFLRIKYRVTNSQRVKNLPEKEKDKHRCTITKERFIELWELHKERYGYTCALTGVPIVPKPTSMKETNKSNSVSVDRLDPNVGYTEENIIFVSNKVNQMKSAVTKELCIAIIKAYEEKGL
jgi:hypothetical protein